MQQAVPLTEPEKQWLLLSMANTCSDSSTIEVLLPRDGLLFGLSLLWQSCFSLQRRITETERLCLVSRPYIGYTDEAASRDSAGCCSQITHKKALQIALSRGVVCFSSWLQVIVP